MSSLLRKYQLERLLVHSWSASSDSSEEEELDTNELRSPSAMKQVIIWPYGLSGHASHLNCEIHFTRLKRVLSHTYVRVAVG